MRYKFEDLTLDGNDALGIYELDVDSEDDKWSEFFILILLAGIHNFLGNSFISC